MTGHMNRSDEEVLALWCAGRNTADIARLLGWPECDVANRLPRILERRQPEDRLKAVMSRDEAARRHTSNL